MRYLVRFLPSDLERERLLRVAKGVAQSMGLKALNPKWTSYGALELDVFAPGPLDFETFLSAVEPFAAVEFSTDLQKPRHFSEKGSLIEAAVSLFNSERFWEAHEVLESLWRVSEGREKLLLQSLILTCASLVHLQKGRPEVAAGVARRALKNMEWDGPSYYGVQVDQLRKTVHSMVESGSLSVFRL